MTPEEKQQFEQIKLQLENISKVVQALGSNTTIPFNIDGAFRDRFKIDEVIRKSGYVPESFVNLPLSSITAPTGGATVDSQARTAINSIITALEDAGIVDQN